MLILWIAVFIVSLIVLVKGADWLLGSSERIGLAMGLSPFIVGVTIVGIGTSFPELVSSSIAAFRGVTDVVAANAIGSNIANILLVVGASALIGGKLVVSKNLIDLDIPLLAATTVLFLVTAWDKIISFPEAIILVGAAIIYVLYTVIHRDDTAKGKSHIEEKEKRPKIRPKDYLLLVVGVAGLAIGANYLVESVVQLSELLNIGTGVISLAAVAFGTSVPELIVSIKAAWNKKSEVALGNIFGSNVFNILAVVGLPALFKTLEIDASTFAIGIPFLIAATLLFLLSGISKRIHLWEGALYLVIYVLFIGKLFNFL